MNDRIKRTTHGKGKELLPSRSQEEEPMEREKNFSFQEGKQGKRHEGVQSDDAVSPIRQNLKEHDNKLNNMNKNIEMLNKVTTLNSMTIQLHNAHITYLMTGHYPPFSEDSPK